MKEQKLVEQRWPVIVAVLLMFVLLATLPDRLRVLPRWVPYVITLFTIAPMAALSTGHQKKVWLRIERGVLAIFFLLYGAAIIVQLTVLIREMLRRTGEISGVQLLDSSIAVWSTNIVMFALIYWRIDRGGPEERVNRGKVVPDWFFPIEGLPAIQPDWTPKFIDYLFVAFTTATSFGPAEAMPLTRRAKLLMMAQALISLVTILAVAARAINILGS